MTPPDSACPGVRAGAARTLMSEAATLGSRGGSGWQLCWTLMVLRSRAWMDGARRGSRVGSQRAPRGWKVRAAAACTEHNAVPLAPRSSFGRLPHMKQACAHPPTHRMQAQISDLCAQLVVVLAAPGRQHHVLLLDIPVDEAAGVHVREPARHVSQQ